MKKKEEKQKSFLDEGYTYLHTSLGKVYTVPIDVQRLEYRRL